MEQPLIYFVFATGIGFAISAIASHTFGAVTKSSTPFKLTVQSDIERLGAIGLLLVCGPHILFRAARTSHAQGDWPEVYVWASYGIGLIWSFIVGFALLSLFSL